MSESILTSSSVPSGNTETAPPNDTFQTSTPNDTFQTSTPNNTFQTSTPNNTFQTSPTRSRTGSAANPLGLPINPGEYPSLGLSGRILSATICLPHTILYTHDESDPWTLTPRAGTSALFDSFTFLSGSQSAWKHVVIGWTGEIDQRRTRKGMTIEQIAVENRPPVNKFSAPIPVNGEAPPTLDSKFKVSRGDRLKLEQKLRHTSETDMVPVWLHEPALDDPEAGLFNDQSRWRRYTEHELYQVFHYKFPEVIDGKIRSSSWDDYVRLNKAFADRVLETYQPGDIIIVHDYQLLLLPRMLRQRIGDIKICSFVHTPFPSFEYFRSLSHRDEIISGMLGADMVAFQSASFADHFRSCCQRLPLGYQASVAGVEADGRHISIEVLPMGINNDEIQQAAFDSAGLDEKMTGILQALKNTKIIVGRDRVDASRGVIQKLQAFGMLLHRYPNWRGNVTLVQVASPATIEDKERGADQTADIIADLVADLNGKFGTFGYVPVCYYTRYLPKDEYYALLRVADVGLITSVRDGMNTVSLEFAMAQKDKHGPLLLSEFSGTASYLKGAININPWDLGGTADKINAALEMPEVQRKEMYDQLLPCLEGNPVQKWVEKLLRKLLIHLEHCKATEVRPMLDVDVVKKYFATSSRRLFIFDYDGTLTPIVEDPDAALPSQDLMSSLVTLAADKRNTVWVVSGRDQAFLIKWLGSIPGLGFSAEHGSFIKYPNTDTWVDLTAGEDLGWQQLTIDAFQGVTDQLPGSVVEKKKVAITWHYRRADPDLGEMNAKALKKKLERTVAVDFDVEVMTGKANIEVRPRSINKGEVVKRLVNIFGHGPDQEPDFVLCLGDDTTDEDMFRALRRSEMPMSRIFSVMVSNGSQSTMASWRIAAPADVIALIGSLSKVE